MAKPIVTAALLVSAISIALPAAAQRHRRAPIDTIPPVAGPLPTGSIPVPLPGGGVPLPRIGLPLPPVGLPGAGVRLPQARVPLDHGRSGPRSVPTADRHGSQNRNRQRWSTPVFGWPTVIYVAPPFGYGYGDQYRVPGDDQRGGRRGRARCAAGLRAGAARTGCAQAAGAAGRCSGIRGRLLHRRAARSRRWRRARCGTAQRADRITGVRAGGVRGQHRRRSDARVSARAPAARAGGSDSACACATGCPRCAEDVLPRPGLLCRRRAAERRGTAGELRREPRRHLHPLTGRASSVPARADPRFTDTVIRRSTEIANSTWISPSSSLASLLLKD